MDLRDQIQSTLGNGYSVDRELGGGGMSRVFVVTESNLGRKVVVKILPPETAGHVSVERFKREIKIAASLQHPHIVPLLAAGDVDGLPYYTMPFVKGESLRERLVKGGELSVKDAVHLLRDVAAALAYAHAEGVVHRDIKPENIILSGGVAVVTDFGVSKAVNVSSTAGSGDPKGGLTSLGVALGTPAYMSPEQASADPHVDHRADIYAFGIVAYELLAGSSPYAGRPAMQMLSAHVTEAPEPLSRRRAAVPPALAALIMKCLEKRAGDRPQSADELLNALDAIATPSGGTEPTSERLRGVRRKSWIAPASAAAIVIAVAAFFLLRPPAEKAYSPGSTTAIAASSDFEYGPQISPDGKLVVFLLATSDGSKLYLRQIGGGPATLLPNDAPGNYASPAWAPDGSRISFWAGEALYVIPAFGGNAKRVVENAEGSHAWAPDGKSIAFIRRGAGIWVQSIDGGAARLVTKGARLHSPAWSPDGRFITYVEGNAPSLSNVSAGIIRTVPVDGGAPVRFSDSTHVNLSPVWTHDGKSILYVSNRDNTRDVYQQFVRANGEPFGSPVRVTTSLGAYGISLSNDGTRLAYDVIRNFSNLWTFADGRGPATMAGARAITKENQHIESLNLSHDGKWVAYDSDRDGNSNIYKIRIDGGAPVQLTSNPATEFAPGWSLDDQEIVFHSNRSGTRDIFVITADGTDEKQVTSGPDDDYFPRWLPDGRSIAFTRGVGGCCAVMVATRDASGGWGAPKRFAPSVGGVGGAWSPDGRTVALASVDGAVLLLAGGDGSVIRRIDGAALGGTPQYTEWGRDGKTVFVMIDGKKGSAIKAIPMGGGPIRIVLADDVAHPFGRGDFTTDGTRFFFSVGQYEGDVHVMELRR